MKGSLKMSNWSRRLPNNIFWLMVFQGASNALALTIRTIVPFFRENGLTLSQVLIIQAIFCLVWAVFEVPSGYLADKWGRKNTLFLGALLLVIGTVIDATGKSFLAFMLGDIFFAFARSLISGADDAILFESLKSEKKQNEYRMWKGKILRVGFYTQIVLTLLNIPFITFLGMRETLWGSVAVYLIMLFSTLKLKEHFVVTKVKVSHIEEIKQVTKKILIEDRILSWSIIFLGIIFVSTQTMLWVYSDYLSSRGFQRETLGYFWVLFNLVAAKGTWIGKILEEKVGEKRSIIISFAVAILGLLFPILLPGVLGVASLLLLQLLRGMNNILLGDLMHKRVQENLRATSMSVKNMVDRVLSLVLLLGISTQTLDDPNHTIGILLGTLIVFGSMWLLFIPKYWR